MKLHKTKAISTLLICVLVFYLYQNYCIVEFDGPLGTTSILIDHHITARDSGTKTQVTLVDTGIEDKFSDQRSSAINKITGQSQRSSSKYHFMIIMIPSMPKSKDYRDYLRHRWLNESCWGRHEFEGIDRQYLDFKLMFVIGKDKFREYTSEFIEEMTLYDDIILIDKVENKKILKDKALWGMKKSIEVYDYKYFIKIDHDTLVDLPHLARGIQTLPDKNLYTGACTSKMKKGEYTGTFPFCVGNAYILSRDLVEKISMLTVQEVDVDIKPEDGYTGWLVSEVKRKFNLSNSETMPLLTTAIVDRYNYNVKYGMFFFDRWFYHWLKEVWRMERAFECRIRANFTLCPSAYYYYEKENSTICLCDTTAKRRAKVLRTSNSIP